MAQKIFKEHVIIARIYQKFGDREILEKSTLQAEEHYTKSLNILGNLNQDKRIQLMTQISLVLF